MENHTIKNPQPPKIERNDIKSPFNNSRYQDIGIQNDSINSSQLTLNRINSSKNNIVLSSDNHNKYPNQIIEKNDNIVWSPMDVGLENLGNTCFMNSTLQCLLHIEPLITYFLQSNNIQSKLNLASPKKGRLAVSFWQLVHDVYRKGGASSVSPSNLQRAVCAHAPYLMDYQQQDSQEFLRFLLDGISEDLCRKHSEINDDDIDEPPTNNQTSIISNNNSLNRTQTNNNLTILPSLTPTHQSNTSPSLTSPATSLASAELSLTPLNIQSRISSSPTTSSNNNYHIYINPNHLQHQQSGHGYHHLFSDDDDSSTAVQHNSSAPCSPTFPSITNNHFHSINNNSNHNSNNSNNNNNNNNRLDTSFPTNRIRSSGTFSVSSSMESNNNNNHYQDQRPSTPINHLSRRNHSQQLVIEDDLGTSIDSSSSSNNNSNNVTRNVELNNSGNYSYKSKIRNDINNARFSLDSIEALKNNNITTIATENLKQFNQINIQTNSNNNNSNNIHSNKKIDSIGKEAQISWEKYLKLNDSIITDIFAGQLQSTIKCLTCNHKSSSFDPFLDLSVPIYRGESDSSSSKNQSSSMFGTIKNTMTNTLSDNIKSSTLEKCLGKFTDGDNMYICEKCKTKQKCVKQLSVYRIPKILVVHIKRFRFNSNRREKLSTDVQFPLNGLDLTPFISNDLVFNKDINIINGINHSIHPIYDLIGVSNHHGNLNSGHYIAHVDTTYGQINNLNPRWKCFNDARVSDVSINNIKGPTAYVLFYKLRI